MNRIVHSRVRWIWALWVIALAFLAMPPIESMASGRAQKPARKAPEKRKKPDAPKVRTRPTWPIGSKSPQLGDGTLRHEVVIAARRVIGIRNSFDNNSFLGHMLAVNGLARTCPRTPCALGLWNRLRSRHAESMKQPPKPGDLAVFRLPKTADSDEVILIGVVVDVQGDRFRFVAPFREDVQEGVATWAKRAKANSRDTALMTCRPPKPVPPAVTGKKGRSGKGKAKVVKAPKPIPCRAGELLVGIVSLDAVVKMVDRPTSRPGQLGGK